MFDHLRDRLSAAFDRVRGQARLTDDNVQEALREVRMALLEADVALPVVRTFIEQVRARALGQEVLRSLTPGQALVKIVHEELVKTMGEGVADLALNVSPPVVILLAGLQGSGKTTTAAKLARHLRERRQRSVLLASCDVYRPAAIDQLRALSAEVGADFYDAGAGNNVDAIARGALEHARRRLNDVLIVDTAGRLHVDERMMEEVRRLHALVNPVETLFVVDAMAGQDAANVARAFGAALPLTGVILTKADGDARGGAALSVRSVTGRPIKFIGIGEKSEALEPFYPDRIASRILGMGDVLSLVEEAERKVDKDKAERMARKLQKGKRFDLEDFRDQIEQMMNLGGVGGLLDKLPGMSAIPKQAASQLDDKQLKRMIAIVHSMTPHERRFPDVIRGSRKRRIAAGSGTQIQDVNRLLKQFAQMQKMMQKMAKGGMKKMLRGMQGRLPPGMMPH